MISINRVYTMLAIIILCYTTPVSNANAEEIPPEIEALIAGWQDNADNVHTIELNAQFTTHYVGYPPFKDYEGNIYKSHTANVMLHKNDHDIRMQIEYDRFFNLSDGAVLYHLPYGEHIIPGNELDRVALKRQFGVTKTTNRYLRLHDKSYQYIVERKQMDVRGATSSHSIPRDIFSTLIENTTLMTKSFPELIRQQAELEQTMMKAQELEDGLFEITILHNADLPKPTAKITLVVDSSKGCNVVAIDITSLGGKEFIANYEYVSRAGAWINSGGSIEVYNPKNHTHLRSVKYSIDTESLAVNDELDETLFSVEGLNLARGTRINDTIDGKTYLYNAGPAELEVAVALAQSEIYNVDATLSAFNDKSVDNTVATQHEPKANSINRTSSIHSNEVGWSRWTRLSAIIGLVVLMATTITFGVKYYANRAK